MIRHECVLTAEYVRTYLSTHADLTIKASPRIQQCRRTLPTEPVNDVQNCNAASFTLTFTCCTSLSLSVANYQAPDLHTGSEFLLSLQLAQ